MNDFSDEAPDDVLSLRDRLPDYATVFGIGFAACFGIGVLIWVISDVSFASSVGYTVILYGIVLMLAGGATGGGYTNLGIGAVGALFGTRRADEAQEEVSTMGGHTSQMDSRDRLRAGLRPEANPRAFWQVLGGATYVALGLFIVIVGS